MTQIRREGEPPRRECDESPYMVYRKKVIRKQQVYQIYIEGTYNY